MSAELGQVLGGYRLDALIGEGGMGCVYRATHVRLGRRAAVKILSASLASDETYVSRFFAEAKIVSEIGHPNIIDIIDFIDTAGPRRVAYIMELIEGPTLGSILLDRALAPIQAFHAAIQLTSAVRAVHAVNVVHRDLKPDNILVVEPLETDLSSVPSIKILDFGIAKIGNSDALRTGAGVILGTPAYMAPEQVAGEPVAPATDVYAIAEIFYEMLTGCRVFEVDGVLALRRKLSAEPVELTYPPGLVVEAEVDALIRSCLAWNHRERPSVDAVLAQLVRLLPAVPRALTRPPRTITARSPSNVHPELRPAPSLDDIAFSRAPTLSRALGDVSLPPVLVEPVAAPLLASPAPTFSEAPPRSSSRTRIVVAASVAILGATGALIASRRADRVHLAPAPPARAPAPSVVAEAAPDAARREPVNAESPPPAPEVAPETKPAAPATAETKNRASARPKAAPPAPRTGPLKRSELGDW